MGPLIKVRIVIQCSYIHAELGNTGGVILLALCIGITIHPNNSHMKHISSQYYSLEKLSIATPSLEMATLFTIFLLALFIIRTNISFFLFSKFEGKIVEGPCQLVNIKWNTTM